MIRGLVHRQVFGVIEGVLWVTLVAIGGSALLGMYSGRSSVPTGPVNPEVESVELQQPVQDRSHYDLILTSRIFGEAAAYVHNAKPEVKKPPPPPKPKETVESKLPLELKGILYAGKDSRFSSVIINVKQQGVGSLAFFPGEQVIDNVYLTKVFEDSVELDNKNANRKEILKLVFDLTGQPANRVAERDVSRPGNVATAPPDRRRPAAQSMMTLQRDDIVKKLENDYEKLASTVDVQEVRDEDGELQGLTADNIESIPSLNELGFKNGDVLVSINNDKVVSQDQITEIANKYRNATIVRVGILRGGQPMSFTYRVR